MSVLKSLLFDCDGVLLDSNALKTEAFERVGAQFGADAAQALVRYHVEQGGVSRYRKFEYLLSTILGQEASLQKIEQLAAQYSECVYNALLSCPLADGIASLRELTPDATWMVVSGGDQKELRAVFSHRKIADYFDGGIFGSPDNKRVILNKLFSEDKIARHPSLFIGDSRYDHEVAFEAGCNFVFATKWTEFHGWERYCEKNNILAVEGVSDLIELIRGNTFPLLG